MSIKKLRRGCSSLDRHRWSPSQEDLNLPCRSISFAVDARWYMPPLVTGSQPQELRLWKTNSQILQRLSPNIRSCHVD
nr:hypothetical protein Iba_chr01aCG18870 [Ipomoea batatas]GMC54086.1 hypothetical protein Iba_chr01dCG12830 [Ipomoea batatas]GMC70044.1 hypothetical protein Iba_chr03aCG12300 [Ipomoea batatas]GMC79080.1 hypothetical protein Iba_chr04aCG7640 [Ipomoea batatas]GMC95048.1 hypothetical protein Iba_chr05cCG4770 [Ipomoea batatas]